jgi:transcriptional regulator with XRE-family HTH domain
MCLSKRGNLGYNKPMSEMKIGKRIEAARTFRKMSRSDLAKNIGVFYQDIVRYEKTNREPHPSTLKKIADTLNVDVNFFLDDIEDYDDLGPIKGYSSLDPYLPRNESTYGELLQGYRESINSSIDEIDDKEKLRMIARMMTPELKEENLKKLEYTIRLLATPPDNPESGVYHGVNFKKNK